MTPTPSQADAPAHVRRQARRQTGPSPPAASSSGTETSDDAPAARKEAARKFETVLVRQFTKVMTEKMFSNSMAGEGGGKWMESQRDRQRKHMTDMITEQLVESNTLGISETLMQKWGATDGGPKPAGPSQKPLDVPSGGPADPIGPTPRLTNPLPTTLNESHIDHAV